MVSKSKEFEKYREDYCIIKYSGLFDEDWYRNRYLRNNKMDSILHFLIEGNKNNFNPSPNFDCSWYLEKYPSVRLANVNPFVHFIKYGKDEGRLPFEFRHDLKYQNDYFTILYSNLFDGPWFIKEYSLRKNIDPIIYYLKKGVSLGLNPSPHFNTNWYLEKYPSVRLANVNPFVHFIKYGKDEGRFPQPCDFNNAVLTYLKSNPQKSFKKRKINNNRF